MIKVVCISDTHTLQKSMIHSIPEGDLLIHAGDAMDSGMEPFELQGYIDWLKEHSHKYDKIIQIAGNHCKLMEKNPRWVREQFSTIPNLVYLENQEYTYKDIKLYGSPITPSFGTGWAFNQDRGAAIKRYWDNIPEDVEILITHGPAYGTLDWVLPNYDTVGCEELAGRIFKLPKLKVHIFGHLHESYGTLEKEGILYINASTCNVNYKPVNRPIEFMFEKGQEPILLG